MFEPAIVTAREMSGNAVFLPQFGVDWGIVCTGRHVQLTWARYVPGSHGTAAISRHRSSIGAGSMIEDCNICHFFILLGS